MCLRLYIQSDLYDTDRDPNLLNFLMVSVTFRGDVYRVLTYGLVDEPHEKK